MLLENLEAEFKSKVAALELELRDKLVAASESLKADLAIIEARLAEILKDQPPAPDPVPPVEPPLE